MMRSKKADITWDELIQLALVALVVLLLVAVGFTLSKLFLSDKDQANVNSFKKLVEEINQQSDNAPRTVQLSILEGYGIYYFMDKEDVTEFVHAPDICGPNCLCLCKIDAIASNCAPKACSQLASTIKEKFYIGGGKSIQSVCVSRDASGAKAQVTVTKQACQS